MSRLINHNQVVEQWGLFELSLHSEAEYENPYRDCNVEAIISCGSDSASISGFYDGEGNWIIRYMPEKEGLYHFVTVSADMEMTGLTGSFECIKPSDGNHGRVRVSEMFHFSYDDGTPFFVVGTTAYGWTYRPEQIRRDTLESFERYGFNKVRMLLTPKYYHGEDGDVDISYDPEVFPFAGDVGKFDFSRFIPEYFRNFEERILELRDRGIEAEIILFHSYDFGKYNIDRMNEEEALYFLNYVIRRFSAFRNVWWSLANEYDVSVEQSETGKPIVRTRTQKRNWDVLGEYIKAHDRYQHLRSIHNYPSGQIYPDRPWMTHVSYQHPNTYDLLRDLKNQYHKPVINDEYQYEGNVKYEWGNSSAEEVVFRHWLSFMAGGYATHGEAYKTEDNNRDIFWTYGGKMQGISARRILFLKQIALDCDFQHLSVDWRNTDGINYFSICKNDEFFLIFARNTLLNKRIYPGNAIKGQYRYRVEEFDVWNCRKTKEYEIDEQTAFIPREWMLLKLTKRQGKE